MNYNIIRNAARGEKNLNQDFYCQHQIIENIQEENLNSFDI